jgi:oligopeptidase B
MQAPKAKKVPKELSIHGDTRIDDYFWMNQREDQEVVDHLNAENAFCNEVLKPTEELQKKLYDEIIGRIKKDDESVPVKKNGHWYYTRYVTEGEYAIHCRRKDSMENDEQIIMDVNKMAEGHSYYGLGGLNVSPNNKLLVFSEDTVSRRIYTLKLKSLESDEILDLNIPGTTGGACWADDNETLFYTEKDETTLRSYRIKSFNIRTKEEKVRFEEKDDTFNCGVYKSKSKKYIVISSGASITSEYQTLLADNADGEFEVFQPRIRGLEYSISHYNDKWSVLTNWDAQNFKLMETSESNTERDNWTEVIAHREETLLEGVETFKKFMVLEERTNGQNHLRIINKKTDQEHYMKFESETYDCWSGANPEFDSEILRYGYTSMTTPSSVCEYDMNTRETTMLKQQTIIGGYDESLYDSKRVWAKARDGKLVPMSVVYKKEFDGDVVTVSDSDENKITSKTRPTLLYAYGSYGHSLDPYFSSVRLSLLDRGFVYVIAHIRGGEDLGRQWYDDGKLLNKMNTFNDYIDCAEHLINHNWTSADKLYAMGGSAGGLLMGVVINKRPDLWKGVISAVPFVDVVTTMLDDTIPLTTGEYDEWGNPNDEEYYHYIKSYSPYDNVEAKEYPNMLITTGLHDSQVQYWEPAKWLAKLREVKTDDNILIMDCNMETGHGGASGRFEALKDTSKEFAFFFMLEGIVK